MVDNFELIKEYMADQLLDWKEGDCYYVQLLRRQADDPKINGVPDPKYHGNMHSRSIKDYFIKSIEHLDDVKEDIIALCKMFNVRAYIRLNKRNYQKLALSMMKQICDQMYSGQTFSSPFHMVASAAGQSSAAGKGKTWIVDMDKEYLPFEQEVKDMICECEPHASNIKWYEDSPLKRSHEEAVKIYQNREFFTVPTKNGKHFIVKPFNMQTFSEKWKEFAEKNASGMKMMDVHKDNPTILYVP